jgi:cytochrome c oxidase subunit 2
MRDVVWLDNMLLVIITIITLFVTGLLAWVCIRYNEKRQPVPATFTHNSPLEVAWTVVPVVILVFIGAFSLPVLFKQQEIPEADITIKVTGYQWYWGYEYPDQKIAFEASMIETKDLKPGQPRLLATDKHVVVPVNKVVKVLITANDVLHAWALPAFGVKRDAVPGRINETWFKAEKEGIFYGQCSELCGIKHAFMPITVEVVSEEKYKEWVEMAKVKYAMYPEKKFLVKKEQ